MSFLNPFALLALVAAGLPAVLHLVERRVPPTVAFPAVRYLSEAERQHSRRLKLRNLLLLLLRTALIALVVLAAARPVVHLPIGRVHAPAALAVVADNSLSSGAVVEGRRVADLIGEEARAVVARTGSDDHLWLVLADGVPRRVTREAADHALALLAPEPLRLDLGEAVRAAARLVASDGLPPEVVVVSDLQASALSGQEPVRVPVTFWRPPPPAEDRAVDSARAEPALWLPDGAVIAAVGGSASGAGEVRLALDGRLAARGLAAPGDRLTLAVREPVSGWRTARVSVGPDELRADDDWYLAVRGAPPTAARVGGGAGPFIAGAIAVLQSAKRLTTDGLAVVTLDDRVASGPTIVFPPADPALVGALNRALAARGVRWRFGDPVSGEWPVTGTLLTGLPGVTVTRRYRLRGNASTGAVLARAGGEPWIVRDGSVVLMASRMAEDWTTLPVTAGFVPLLDRLVNGLAAGEAAHVTATPAGVVAAPPGATALRTPAGAVPIGADARVTAPITPGVYYFTGSAGDTVGALEVNHDPRESRLAQADAEQLAATFGPTVRLDDAAALDRDLFRGARRAELAGVLLVLALVAGVTELAVATGMGKR